eukprot:157767_1
MQFKYNTGSFNIDESTHTITRSGGNRGNAETILFGPTIICNKTTKSTISIKVNKLHNSQNMSIGLVTEKCALKGGMFPRNGEHYGFRSDGSTKLSRSIDKYGNGDTLSLILDMKYRSISYKINKNINQQSIDGIFVYNIQSNIKYKWAATLWTSGDSFTISDLTTSSNTELKNDDEFNELELKKINLHKNG